MSEAQVIESSEAAVAYAELLIKFDALQAAAWDLLSALEGQHPDQVFKAKRRLGLVFLDL